MDLLDRYLAAIRHNLPVSRAEDITNELRDELLDRMEAREAALGRPLEQAEVSEIIQAYGPPLKVAGRYREHQYLIGPESYPFYLYGLRVVVVIALVVLLFSGVVPMLMGGDHPAEAFFSGLGHAYNAFILGFGWFTIFFAVGERIGSPGARFNAWNPKALPPVVDKKPHNRWASPIQVGLCVLLLLVWTGIIPIPVPVGHGGRGVHLTPAPIWSQYYWPVLILGVATLAYNVVGWLRPNWNPARLALALGTQIGWIWAAATLRVNGPWFLATSAPEFAAQATRSQAGVNAIIGLTLSFALVVWVIGLAFFVYRHFLRRFIVGR